MLFRSAQLKGFRDNPDGDPDAVKGGNRAGDIARALRRRELDNQISGLEATIAGVEKAVTAQGKLNKIAADEAAGLKAASAARREHNKELRAAESAARAAAKEQEKLAQWIKDTRLSAQGNVQKEASRIEQQNLEWKLARSEERR